MVGESAIVTPAPSGRWPRTVVARETARRGVRSAVLWGVIFGVYVTESATGYEGAYKTSGQRHALAQTLGSDVGISAIIGPASHLDTVAGFVAWRTLGVLTVVGAVWGLLAATRLLRGEEDAGRWELLLAGRTTRRGGAAPALTGLAGCALVLWAITAVIAVAVGRSSSVHIDGRSALFLAVADVSGAAVFLAVGALTSQLAPTRRQAASYAGGVLGVAYALRMVADSGAGLAWLRWASPLGWVEELHPLTAPRPVALVPIVGLIAILTVLTVQLAGGRDLGASTIPDRSRPPTRTMLLSGPTGLTVRLVRPVVIGWVVAIALAGLMLGLIAKAAGRALTGSTAMRKLVSDFGAHGAGATTYLGVAFLMVALLLALIAAGQVGAARGEEAEGKLDHLLVRPVSRTSWLAGRLSVATGALVIAGAVAGVTGWLGAASQDSGIGLTNMVAAGLNLVPPAVLILGVGTLAFGIRPRAASGACYAVLAWSFLVELIGGIVNASHWLLDTSVFHQMAAAPAVAPDWTTNAVLVALGVAAAAIGGIVFRFRDLAGA